MKHIADSLGISEPAVYCHFKNKTAIAKGIIENFYGNIIVRNEDIEFVRSSAEIKDMCFATMHDHRDLLY